MHLASVHPKVLFVLCKDSPDVLVYSGAIEGEHRCTVTLRASEATALSLLYSLTALHSVCALSVPRHSCQGNLCKWILSLHHVGLRD